MMCSCRAGSLNEDLLHRHSEAWDKIVHRQRVADAVYLWRLAGAILHDGFRARIRDPHDADPSLVVVGYFGEDFRHRVILASRLEGQLRDSLKVTLGGTADGQGCVRNKHRIGAYEPIGIAPQDDAHIAAAGFAEAAALALN